jgi:hypothetical protein
MKHFARWIALTTIVATTAAEAQQYAPPPPPPGQGYSQPGAVDQTETEELAPPPPNAAPNNLPPRPPQSVPPAVSAPAAQPLPPPPPRQGEWTYTAQYGWVWMPYGRRYVYVTDDSASMYVFYPHYGWRWVASPWVIGLGPIPRWGPRGPVRFVWYSRPWFRVHHVWAARRPYVVVRRPVVVRRRHHW